MEETKKKARWNAQKTQTLVGLGMLTALVVVLQVFAGGISLGGIATITLALVPIIVGAALYGWKGGAWLGFAFGVVVLCMPTTAFFLNMSIPGTFITVLLKGALAGLCASLCYNLFAKKNQYAAVIAAGVITPIVNTGIYLLGCFVFFMDYLKGAAAEKSLSLLKYIITVVVGWNLPLELAINLILASAIVMIINVVQKNIIKSK